MTKKKIKEDKESNEKGLNIDTKICQNCTRTYDYDPYKNNHAPFCSKECMSECMKGG